MTKLRFTVRRYLVIDEDGGVDAHDFVLILDLEAIPNSHFRKALKNKSQTREMARGALKIVAQQVPDYRAGEEINDK